MGPAIIGGALSLASMIGNNIAAGNRADRDRLGNYTYNELSAENAYARQRQMYEDYYSPSALVKQYMEAGLSPAMMFGGTPGQGGTSAPQGNGTAGVQTPFYPVNLMEALQAKLLDAQARKTNAETETIEGKNERGASEIRSIQVQNDKTIQETNNVELQSANLAINNRILEIQETITAATADNVIETSSKSLQLLLKQIAETEEKVRQLKATNHITEAASEDIITAYKKQVTLLTRDIFLKLAQTKQAHSQIEVNLAQANELSERVWQNWQDLYIKGETNRINEERLKSIVEQWAFENGIKSQENVRGWVTILTNFLTGIIGKAGSAIDKGGSALVKAL